MRQQGSGWARRTAIVAVVAVALWATGAAAQSPPPAPAAEEKKEEKNTRAYLDQPLSAPLLLGLSLSEYYEFGTGHDSTYGYFQGGLGLSVPLAFIPASLGSWQFKTGVNFLNLGGNLKDVNKNDSFEVIGTFGIA